MKIIKIIIILFYFFPLIIKSSTLNGDTFEMKKENDFCTSVNRFIYLFIFFFLLSKKKKTNTRCILLYYSLYNSKLKYSSSTFFENFDCEMSDRLCDR